MNVFGNIHNPEALIVMHQRGAQRFDGRHRATEIGKSILKRCWEII